MKEIEKVRERVRDRKKERKKERLAMSISSKGRKY